MNKLFVVAAVTTVAGALHGCAKNGDTSERWTGPPADDPVILHDGWATPDTIFLRRIENEQIARAVACHS